VVGCIGAVSVDRIGYVNGTGHIVVAVDGGMLAVITFTCAARARAVPDIVAFYVNVCSPAAGFYASINGVPKAVIAISRRRTFHAPVVGFLANAGRPGAVPGAPH
jgi:hypothetical protein